MPLISSVCRESRNVVFRTLDVILYRKHPPERDLQGYGPDAHDIDNFLSNIRGRNDEPAICLLAEHFVAGPSSDSWGSCVMEWSGWDNNLEEDEVVGEPRNRRALSHLRQGVEHDRKMDVDVVVEFLPLWTTPELARASGLFGLAGDEHSQLVDCDDLITLAKFRALHDENDAHWPFKHPDTEFTKRHETILSLDFQNDVKKWLDNALQSLLVMKWRHARRCDPENIVFEESKSAIVSPPETFNYDGTVLTVPGHTSYRLNEEHPWVIEERRKLPKLRPKIWFLSCKRRRRYDTQAIA
ncbi:hypothetical protein NLG97_g5776 [Lecanicillium saksenae]|uniref:Uncharacterized protein n=1 Tax=Lecanicillium saksenae TaxID=468837 RepID=A0ACC1QSV6_9HYPO|nr:hypothetical protein NLG97_g5776 [Lecanicillium saksenae]